MSSRHADKCEYEQEQGRLVVPIPLRAPTSAGDPSETRVGFKSRELRAFSGNIFDIQQG
jgi:hypothetical protein